MFEFPWVLLLVTGSLYWWAFIVAMSVVFIWCIEEEWHKTLGFATFVTLLGFLLFGNLGPWVMENPIGTLYWIGGFCIAGIGTGVFKWQMYLTSKRAAYDDKKHEFLTEKGVSPNGNVPERLKEEWVNELLKDYRFRYPPHKDYNNSKVNLRVQPYAREHKSKITIWMMWWPWTLFWTFLDDIIKNFWRWVTNKLVVVLDAMAIRSFRGTEDDLVVEETAEEE